MISGNDGMGKTKLSSQTTHDVVSEHSAPHAMGHGGSIGGHASSHVNGSEGFHPTRGSTEASSGLAEGNLIAVGVDVNGE